MEILIVCIPCPHCDGLRTTRLPQTNVDSTVTWYRCEHCDRLFYQPMPGGSQLHPVVLAS